MKEFIQTVALDVDFIGQKYDTTCNTSIDLETLREDGAVSH